MSAKRRLWRRSSFFFAFFLFIAVERTEWRIFSSPISQRIWVVGFQYICFTANVFVGLSPVFRNGGNVLPFCLLWFPREEEMFMAFQFTGRLDWIAARG